MPDLAGRAVTVGLSGGLDSVCLLRVLHQLQDSIPHILRAVHVHHGLSPNADYWAESCQRLCERLEVPLQVFRVVVRRHGGQSLEAEARRARYEVYEALQTDIVALAHHLDDQAETVLLQLLRGGGVRGMAAMPAQRKLESGTILWRPLLQTPRTALQAWMSQEGADWVEDESNQDSRFDRNFLRNEVVPILKSRFDDCAEVLDATSRQMGMTASLTDDLAELDCGLWNGVLDLARLASLPDRRKLNALRWFMARYKVSLTGRQLEEWARQLWNGAADAMPVLVQGKRAFRRYREKLFVDDLTLNPSPVSLGWQGQANLTLKDWGGEMRFEIVPERGIDRSILPRLTIRPRSGGELIRPGPGRPLRPVKHLFQEADIPPWLRKRWPLLFDGDALVAVPSLAIAAEYQSIDGFRPQWRPNDWPDRDLPRWI